jgi:uncharacterized protein (TIGR03382 family)
MNKSIVAFLALSTLAACDHEPTAREIGDIYLAKYADELVVPAQLEPGPTPLATPRPVLLITGVTIPAKWFDPIVARLTRDGFIPVVYEPPDLLSGDLFMNTQLLAQVVDKVRADYGVQKIDILAECTGGLIARHYIQSLGGDQYVSRMVTFVSPQHGLPKAALAYQYAPWPAIRDLTPGSAFLSAVNGKNPPASVPFTSIYTCTDEYIQPYETSKIPGATNIGLCDKFVGHFQTFYDPEIYLIMHAALVKGDPGQPVDPTMPPADPNDPNDPSDDADGGGCNTGGDTSNTGALLLVAAALLARRKRG